MLRAARRRSRVARAHEKFRTRLRQVRRRPWRTAAVLTILLGLIGGVVFLFGYSAAFVVKSVTVSGATGELARQVRDQASASMGLPLARVDLGQIEEAVRSDLRVETADVGRSWPSTITVELTLREPAIAVDRPGNRIDLADRHGVIFTSVADKPDGIPRVKAPAGSPDPALLEGTVTMLDALPRQVRQGVHAVAIDADGMIEFRRGSASIIWGGPDQPELKARVLTGLLAQKVLKRAGEAPLTIDLSVPGTPVVSGLTLPKES